MQRSLRHHIFTRASALSNTTFLAVIPTFILLHSIAGSFGILDLAVNVFPLLNRDLQLGLPMTALKPIIGHAQTIGFGQLGIIGSLGLFFTFILALDNLETNLNVVWHVRSNRSLFRKALVAVPFLIFLGLLIGFATVILSYLKQWLILLAQQGLIVLQGGYWHWLGSRLLFLIAHLLFWLILFLLFFWLPNTKIRWKIAMTSALITLVAARLLVWGFLLVKGLVFGRMSLFYGSLAFIPLVMLLVYSLWCVILFGNALCWRLHHWPPHKSAEIKGDDL